MRLCVNIDIIMYLFYITISGGIFQYRIFCVILVLNVSQGFTSWNAA